MPILPHKKSWILTAVQLLQAAFEVYICTIENGLEKYGVEDVEERISRTKQIWKTSVEMSWLQNNQLNG